MQSQTVAACHRLARKRPASRRTVALLAVILFGALPVMAQTDSSKEFWPAIRLNVDLAPRVGLLVYGEQQNGEESPTAEQKAGVTVTYRVKPLFKLLHGDPDSENEYLVSAAIGYEYLRKTKSGGQPSNENRLLVESTPRYAPGAGFLLLNRQRMEFRWIDGAYNFRYRFKVKAQRAFNINRFRFTPYASGELFWDRNRHSWNQNEYAFGVQLPFRRRLMLDTYVLHQNCTTCSDRSVNALGVSLNLYFRRAK
jgi:hypothetical protein